MFCFLCSQFFTFFFLFFFSICLVQLSQSPFLALALCVMNVIPITKFVLTETLKLKLMPTSCFFLLHFQQKYERLATGSIPIESYLHEHLAEHLNSEIVLQTITDLASAMVWLRSTFLYVRALGAPVRYGLPAAKDKAQIERNLEGDETTCQSWTIKILTLFFFRTLPHRAECPGEILRNCDRRERSRRRIRRWG